MKITDIKVFPVREDKLKAFVSIILDDCFMVNDIKVIRGQDGFFISMPSRRKRSGKFKDIAHPLNNETRQAMEKEILAAYEASPEAADQGAAEVRPAGSDASRSEGRPRRRRRRSRRGARRPPAGEGGESRASEPRAATSGSPEPGESRKSREPQEPGSQPEQSWRREPAEPVERAEKAQPTESARRSESEKSPKPPKPEESADQSAEEVAEKHLSDSFWGT